METIKHLAVIIFSICNLWSVDSSKPFIANRPSGAINCSSSFIKENTCSWIIEVLPGHYISLKFTTLNILNQVGSKSSSVKVYDGRNKSQTLLGHYTEIKCHLTLQSTERYMLVIANGSSNFEAVYNSSKKAKLEVVIPLQMVRTVLEHDVWCLSDGTRPINISMGSSTTTLAFGTGMVKSKIKQDGYYSCNATNEHGNDSKTFHVSLIDFYVCESLCHCSSTAERSEVENIFNCTEKHSAHLLNNIPTTTTDLYLDNNKIPQLSDDVFSRLTRLSTLHLVNNAIRELPANIFSNLRHLSTLHLRDDSITKLPANVFSKLTRLSTLFLDYNEITQLPDDVFSNLTCLSALGLSNNKLTQFPNISGLTSLRYVFLDHNSISYLPDKDFFSSLTSLSMLWLSDNDITEIPDKVFSELPSLRYLMLSDNPINYVGDKVFTVRPNRNLVIYMIRANLTQFDVESFDNSKEITPILTVYEGAISNIRFEENCVIRMGVETNDSEFIDISKEDANVQEPLRKVLHQAGFARYHNKSDSKVGPCPLGTFLHISDTRLPRPKCRDCPPGGYFQNTTAFVRNSCQRCAIGTYVHSDKAPGTSRLNCSACPQGTNTSDFAGFRGCKCLPGFFRKHMFDDCQPLKTQYPSECPSAEGMHLDGIDCKTDAVKLVRGFWWKWVNDTNRKNFASFSYLLSKNISAGKQSVVEYQDCLPVAHKCPRTKSCHGDVNATCADGHEGPLCEVCKHGYYKQLKTCRKCPSKAMMITQLSVMTAVAIIMTAVAVWRSRKQANNKQSRSLVDMIVGKLKIVMGFYQVTFGVLDAFTFVEWPESLEEIGKYSEMLQLNFFQIAPIHCLFPDLKVDAFGRLFTVLVFNASVVILGFIIYGIRKVLLSRKTFQSQVEKVKKVSETKQLVYRTVFFFLYVTYLSTCSKTANVLPLACHELCIDNELKLCNTYLKADYTVECTTPQFRRYVIVAYCNILYIVFLPLAVLVILWKDQKSLKKHGDGGDDESTHSQHSVPEMVRGLRFICSNYDSRSWYWELVETARKVTLTSGIILIGSENRAFVGLACVMSGLYGLLFSFRRPLLDQSENNLLLCTLAVTFVNLGIGSVCKVPAERAQNLQETYDYMEHVVFKALVFAANFLVIGMLVVQYFSHIFRFIKEWRQNPQWSVSCFLALLLPLNDLQSEIRGTAGKNLLTQQVQTGKIDMPSVSSTLNESGAVSFDLAAIHEQAEGSVNFGFDGNDNGGLEEEDADKVAFVSRKKLDHLANPRATFDTYL
ncbi:uncharacterized protein [Montipora capricornis]|uniref:uncharacterized protein isoform X1 n=2 Tax=Montipora capricornis TaxID=246305 RepID=UPI0035F11A71